MCSRWCASTSPCCPSATASARRRAGAAAGAWAWRTSRHTRRSRWREEAARQAVVLQSAIEAPAGTFPVVLAAGDSGILLHEAIGHGLEADFNRKKTSNYTDQIGNLVASELCTVVDDGTIQDSRGTINIDDEGNRPGYNVLIERRGATRLHPGPHEHEALRREADGQRPPPVLPPPPDAAHDEHLHAGRRVQPRGHHPLCRARDLLRIVQRRAGRHQQRRLRVQRDRGLSHRRWQGSRRRSAT